MANIYVILPSIVWIQVFQEGNVFCHGTAHWVRHGSWILSCRWISVHNITSWSCPIIIWWAGRWITMAGAGAGQILIKICEYFVCCPVAASSHGCVWPLTDRLWSHLFHSSKYWLDVVVTPSQCHPQLTLLCSGSELCSRHTQFWLSLWSQLWVL